MFANGSTLMVTPKRSICGRVRMLNLELRILPDEVSSRRPNHGHRILNVYVGGRFTIKQRSGLKQPEGSPGSAFSHSYPTMDKSGKFALSSGIMRSANRVSKIRLTARTVLFRIDAFRFPASPMYLLPPNLFRAASLQA